MRESTAEVWQRFLEAIPRTEKGFRLERVWHYATQLAREEAVSVEADRRAGNADPTETLTFPDGSVMEIANPDQYAFMGFTRLIED